MGFNSGFKGLTKPTKTTNNSGKNTHTEHVRLINLTNVTFTKEHISTLALGLNYALEKDPKHYMNELIIDTENAIRHLQPNIQSTFWYLAIKQIMTTNTHNTVHKKYQYILHQIKKILQRNNLTIAKAVRVKQNKKKTRLDRHFEFIFIVGLWYLFDHSHWEYIQHSCTSVAFLHLFVNLSSYSQI